MLCVLEKLLSIKQLQAPESMRVWNGVVLLGIYRETGNATLGLGLGLGRREVVAGDFGSTQVGTFNLIG